MVDKERLAQYLSSLDRLLRDWRSLKSRASLKDLEEQRALAHQVCYVLLAAIQTAIDLANQFGAAQPSGILRAAGGPVACPSDGIFSAARIAVLRRRAQ